MYELINGRVWSVANVTTKTQTAVVKQYDRELRRILASADKQALAVGEVATITVQWQVFNLTSGQYVNENSTTAIQVDAAGTTDELIPVGGVAQFEFSSAVAGEFVIRTTNALADNAELVVTVQ